MILYVFSVFSLLNFISKFRSIGSTSTKHFLYIDQVIKVTASDFFPLLSEEKLVVVFSFVTTYSLKDVHVQYNMQLFF